MNTASEKRVARSKARHSWSMTSHDLRSTPGANLVSSTTASERLAMMWELAQRAWALAGRPFPAYSRLEIPGDMRSLGE